jgi:cytosine/adenosine deaminase-related metal-dependent hydrolase
VAAGARLSLGSDSHAMIDLLEEARLIELHERLAHHHRGTHSPAALLGAATAAGYRALGWSGAGDGRPAPTGLAPGGPADFAVLDPGSVRLAGIDAAEGVAGVVFAATAADVTDVVVGGRTIVRGRSHVTVPDVARDLHRAITSVWART